VARIFETFEVVVLGEVEGEKAVEEWGGEWMKMFGVEMEAAVDVEIVGE
jgi:hypothetical protein